VCNISKRSEQCGDVVGSHDAAGLIGAKRADRLGGFETVVVGKRNTRRAIAPDCVRELQIAGRQGR
jgi:hypothetical protein